MCLQGRPYGYLRPDIENMLGVAEDWNTTGTRSDDLMMLSGELLEIRGLYSSGPTNKITVVCNSLINPVVGSQSFNIPQWYLADIINDFRGDRLWCKECYKPLYKFAVKEDKCPVCLEEVKPMSSSDYSIFGKKNWVLYTENTGTVVKQGTSIDFRKWIQANKVDLVTLYRRLDGSGQLQVRLTQPEEGYCKLIAEYSFDNYTVMKGWLEDEKWMKGVDVREQSTIISLFWYKAKQSFNNYDENEPCEEFFHSYASSVEKKLLELQGNNKLTEQSLTDFLYSLISDRNWHAQGASDNARDIKEQERMGRCTKVSEGMRDGKLSEVCSVECVINAVKFIREVVDNEVD